MENIAVRIGENRWDGLKVVDGLPRQGRGVMATRQCRIALLLYIKLFTIRYRGLQKFCVRRQMLQQKFFITQPFVSANVHIFTLSYGVINCLLDIL